MLSPLLLLAGVQLVPAPDAPPYRQPQAVVVGSSVSVVYASGSTVYHARSTDSGATFGVPSRVAGLGRASVGRHRGPRLAAVGGALVVSAIVAEQGGGKDGDLVAWRSTDGGRTWSAGAKLNDAPGAAREGLHGMASDGKSLLVAAWLDLRQPGTRLYTSVSRDGGQTWSANRLAYASPDGRICECCHPTVAVSPSGEIAVLFRNSLAGARDLYVVRSRDAGDSFSPAEKQGQGTWLLNACPMDGGSAAFAGNSGLVTVWRRNSDVFLAQGPAPETRIAPGKDPSLTLSPIGPFVAWTGSNGLEVKRPGTTEPAVLDPTGAYVHLASDPNGLVMAVWESNHSLRITRLQ